MAISEEAQAALDMASRSGDLESALVIGKDAEGKVAIFTTDASKEAMIVLLERARNQLVRSLDD